MSKVYGNEEDYEETYDKEEFFEEDDDPIADVLYDIVTHMGFENVDIEWEERTDHTRYFVEGEGLGILIGRHGATLEALQYIVGVINSRQQLVEHKIIVDIEGYRERRERHLRTQAHQEALVAVREGKEVVLEPMPACDRRIIHVCLHNNPAVKTYSEGEEPDRCVVIQPVR
ncbi:KH domain-containing protein [bacterium]|nr:KH domain-containing protein [bacterium]